MIFLKNAKHNWKVIVWILVSLIIVSCSGGDAALEEVTATAPPVEYGASVEEWEAAQIAATPTLAVVNEVAAAPTVASSPPTLTPPPIKMVDISGTTYQEIMWEALVPAEFTSAAIMAKYQEELAQFDDGDPQAMEVYMQMQEEFDNAPVNGEIDGTWVRIPGFIAPLEYSEDNVITQFLLVPYFGACIHVPPPPVNQTIMVQTTEEYGIAVEDSYDPIWVMGRLTTEGASTELAEAGYSIQDAIIEPYDIDAP